METKTWAKRVAALSTGALMLGATMMGAMAAYDLGTYPEPFVKDGMLSDTVLVVGAAADSADVLGAVDIAAALQAAAKTPAASGTSTAPTTDDGVKVEKSGNKYNYNDDLYDVHPEALDDTDLPELLADGTFEDDEGDNTGDEDYTQELTFDNGNVNFVQDTPEDGVGGNYVQIEDGDALYTYTLEFDDSVGFDTSNPDDDLVGTKMEIMGKVYTITDAQQTSQVLDSLTLTSGDSTVWLTQDHPLEFGGDTITVVDVGNDGTKCGVDVNGHVEWITEGATSDSFPSDLAVGVLEVIETATEGENACELSLGSAELVFEDGQEVTVNDDAVDGTDVQFQGSAGDWTGFTVAYTVDVDLDTTDVYLAEGDAWTDPVFGSWKIEFAGVTGDYEPMDWKSTGEDATFTFLNADGEEVEIAWHHDGTAVYLGYDDDEPLLLPAAGAGEAATHGLATTNPENVRLLYTTSGGESHILRLDGVDCDDATRNETTFVDETYGNEYTEEVDCDGDPHTVTIGSLGTATLQLSATEVNFTADGGGSIETKYEGVIALGQRSWRFTEDAGDEQNVNMVFLNMSWDDTDDEIFQQHLGNSTNGAQTVAYAGVEKEDGDDDVKMDVTDKGTLIEYDNDEKLSVSVLAPEEDAYANVFVTPLNAKISSGAAGGDAYNVNAFEVGLAVLDSDAEGMNKNMIIVGGPCANTLAMEVMDATKENCGAGFEEGKAMIKYFDRSGKAALLVAGYEARDTRGASYVLAAYGDYDLSGDEVEVVSTNLEDLKVNKV